jgi:hypothetical protein
MPFKPRQNLLKTPEKPTLTGEITSPLRNKAIQSKESPFQLMTFSENPSRHCSFFKEQAGMISLDRSNATMNHTLTANCLRKCTYWQLGIVETTNRQEVFKVAKNSGISLR